MSSRVFQAQAARSCGKQEIYRWQERKFSKWIIRGGVLTFTVFAVALVGSALLGPEGQASTEMFSGRGSIGERSVLKENPLRVVPSAAESIDRTLGRAQAEGVFESRLPEQAQPETGALGYLRLLEHLPAQPPAIGKVSSPFGTRVVPRREHHYAAQDYLQGGSRLGREEFHSGIDIAVPPGTPVRAPGPGIVIATGRSPRLGTYVRLLHKEVQLETVLAHLSRVAGVLERGQPVRRGEVVGFSGNSGRSTGPHLHFEVRSLPGLVPVDPTEVYALYFTCLDHLSRFPIGAIHARLEPYRI